MQLQLGALHQQSHDQAGECERGDDRVDPTEEVSGDAIGSHVNGGPCSGIALP